MTGTYLTKFTFLGHIQQMLPCRYILTFTANNQKKDRLHLKI